MQLRARDFSGLPSDDVSLDESKTLDLASPVEDLGLSRRTRNALRGIGCDTVGDVLRLELNTGVRGVGRKTKEELLAALDLAGFHHPSVEGQPDSDIEVLDRSLQRMQNRIETALGALAKEVRLLRQRLRKRVT